MATNETDRLTMMARQYGKTNMANEEMRETELLARLGLDLDEDADEAADNPVAGARRELQRFGDSGENNIRRVLSAIARLRDEAAKLLKPIDGGALPDSHAAAVEAINAQEARAKLADMGALISMVLR